VSGTFCAKHPEGEFLAKGIGHFFPADPKRMGLVLENLMSDSRFTAIVATLLTLGVGLVSGCRSETADPAVQALRGQYVLAEEPVGELTLTQVAHRLDGAAGESETDSAASPDPISQPVVLVGRIYAGDLEPWDTGKASFLLAELPEEGHGEGHDADNCPFCKRKAANAPTAIVQFIDDTGEVIPRDARELFGVKKNDVVTIRGQATRGELNTLIVTADAIHVRGK
jgi:hypothetical protein